MADSSVSRRRRGWIRRGFAQRQPTRTRFVTLPLLVIILLAFGSAISLNARAADGPASAARDAQVKPRFTSSLSISVLKGQTLTFIITATGKPAPTVFVLPGAHLPPGVVFGGGSGGKGTLSGTPTKLGETSFEIEAANAAGITAQKMKVFTKRSPGKPVTSYRALKSEAFRLTLANPTAVAPSTGSISCAGHFPVGVSFGSSPRGLTGALSGDPQSTGRFSITCSARNSFTGTTERWTLVLLVSASGKAPTCLNQTLNEVAGAPFALTVPAAGDPYSQRRTVWSVASGGEPRH